uniref:MIR domain-containing protein n=1 Tax=Rhizophagus irregularis (strain DAOM 181602 / DAOM 197198 / MUCL 43194) TaxID=747089 RepID=U9U201_RHIID
MENVDSINKLIKEFEVFAIYLSELIVNESVVALKHVATGKYLSSIENLCYKTGSKTQLVFVESPEPGPNSLWKINFNDKELATYAGTSIGLQHIKSNKFLGICYEGYQGNFIYGLYGYYKSPLTKQTWVWEKHTEAVAEMKINGTSSTKKYDSNGDSTSDRQVEFLRSHDIQFTIRGDTFQEVCCHNEILGVNDEYKTADGLSLDIIHKIFNIDYFIDLHTSSGLKVLSPELPESVIIIRVF